MKRLYTYAEATERSWPHNRVLVGLMEGVAGPKKEPVQLKSLRLALEKVDVQIEALQGVRRTLDTELVRSCTHPLDRLVVEETTEEKTKWTVRCSTCRQNIRHHTRD